MVQDPGKKELTKARQSHGRRQRLSISSTSSTRGWDMTKFKRGFGDLSWCSNQTEG